MQLKVVCFSDTHTHHERCRIPECDLLLFGGDFSNLGYLEESIDFMDWFNDQHQATEKVFICGNHEVNIDPDRRQGLHPQWFSDALERYTNIHYLYHSSINLWGLNIFGSPYTPDFLPEHWGYNVPRGRRIAEKWSQIPDDTDILITHGPMKGYLDMVPGDPNLYSVYPVGHVGCFDLLERAQKLSQLKLKLFVCGHIHGNTDVIDVYAGDRSFKYVNAAVLDNRYRFIRQPIVLTLDI